MEMELLPAIQELSIKVELCFGPLEPPII